MNYNTGRSLIKFENNNTKKLQGLIRIHADVLTLIEIINSIMQKCKTNNCKHFDDYHSIILYRKLFLKDNREAVLTLNNLKDASSEQKKLHKRLYELTNKHIAHSDKTEYDPVRIYIVIDNNTNIAIDIEIIQDFFEPLSCPEFINVYDLLNFIKGVVLQNIQETKKEIINQYNKN